MVQLAFTSLAVGAGVGLLASKEWGRVLAIVHSALSLFNIPFGTAIGALALVYLLRSRTREYFAGAPE